MYAVRLTWTAVGNRGYEGRAAMYEMRAFRRWDAYSMFGSVDSAYKHFPVVDIMGLRPAESGRRESLLLWVEEPGTYYYCMKVMSVDGLWSRVSPVCVKEVK